MADGHTFVKTGAGASPWNSSGCDLDRLVVEVAGRDESLNLIVRGN